MSFCMLISCAKTPAAEEQPSDTDRVVSSEAETEAEPLEFLDLGMFSLMSEIHIDQLGYRPADVKKAVIPQENADFSVVRVSDGAVMFSGSAGDPITDPASEDTVRIAEFSELDQAGEYVIVTGEMSSYPFLIDENPYKDLRAATLEMFNYQKCGVDLDMGVWSHAACHTELATLIDTDITKDVSGGWHDAGDYGRYIVPAAKTVADLLMAYELSPSPDEEVLEITWFELEWALKMQDEESGGVYHKVSCRNFNALDQMPDLETSPLVLSPVSMAATADFAAVMAMASRFYPDKKDILLDAAVRAWEWCEANPRSGGFRNPRGINTGEYGDANLSDERFWAACELFAATGEEKYHDFIKDSRISDGLGWGDMGLYGIMSYLFNAGDKADADLTQKLKDKLITSCQGIMENYNGDVYGVSLGTNYYWGSNMSVGNNAMQLLLGAYFADEQDAAAYEEAAIEHMRYLVGKNSLSQCYITGFGSVPALNPHHRPSVAAGEAVPGMVVGGPNKSTGDDPALKASRAGYPPAKCYIDHKDSYASNEITIYWNSPVYFTLALLYN